MSSRRTSVPVDEELISIAREIVGAERTEAMWAELESDDMFQTSHWCGGYEADEEAFTFSFWDTNGREYWCLLTLARIADIAAGTIHTVLVDEARE